MRNPYDPRFRAAAWAVDARAKDKAAKTGQPVVTTGVNGDQVRFYPDGREEFVRGSNRRD